MTDNASATPPEPQLTPKPQGKRRVGRFQISHITLSADWHAVLPLMAKVAVLKAESLYHIAAIEYLALCDEFDDIEVTDTPPLYRPSYRLVDGVDTFHFTRIKKETDWLEVEGENGERKFEEFEAAK